MHSDLLQQYSALLCSGTVVAIPTETVYGLAASIESERAVRDVYALKNRPCDNPLIVHVANQKQLRDVASAVSPLEQALIDAFWPGGLTLVLHAKASLSPLITAGQTTVAVRMPRHKSTLALIEMTGPLVAPSANRSTFPSATHPSHVRSDFGEDFPLLDGGACTEGLESTIVRVQDNTIEILRHGVVTETMLQEHAEVISHPSKTPKTPGSRYLHYAPQTPLSKLEDPSTYHPVIIGFEDRLYSCTHLLSLGYSTDRASIANALYATLRLLDTQGFAHAVIDCSVPDTSEYAAIRDRLEKVTGRAPGFAHK